MSLQKKRLKSSLPKTATLTSESSTSPDRGTPPSADHHERDHGSVSSQRASTASRTTTSKRRLERRITPLVVLQQTGQASVRKVFDLRRFLYVLGLYLLFFSRRSCPLYVSPSFLGPLLLPPLGLFFIALIYFLTSVSDSKTRPREAKPDIFWRIVLK